MITENLSRWEKNLIHRYKQELNTTVIYSLIRVDKARLGISMKIVFLKVYKITVYEYCTFYTTFIKIAYNIIEEETE